MSNEDEEDKYNKMVKLGTLYGIFKGEISKIESCTTCAGRIDVIGNCKMIDGFEVEFLGTLEECKKIANYRATKMDRFGRIIEVI